MSITAGNASYAVSSGPTKSGQIVANNITGPVGRMITGTFEIVLDGSLTVFDVNWIDGTETLAWTPTVVLLTRIPSSAATDALASIVPTSISTINTTKMTVNISAAGSNTNKFRCAFMAY